MKIDDYRLLVALEEAKTVRGASKLLLVSQPAVSQRLKNIEQEWGKTLFIRTSQQLLITPSGEKVLQFARSVVDQEKKVALSLASESDEVGGTLSLGVSSTVAQHLLPVLLQRFFHSYPKVQLELMSGHSSDIIHSVHHFHLQIIRGEKPPIGDSFLLLKDPLFLIEKKSKPESPKPMIEFQTDSSFHLIVQEWLIKNPQYLSKAKIKVDQMETSKQLLINGIGKTVLPGLAMTGLNEEEYTFIPLEKKGETIYRETWVSYDEHSLQLPQVQAFLTMLQTYKKEGLSFEQV
ncbi:LysR family transcriptional regulator [Alkalihalobacillus pseudalcaliphilus]|uniref:LysR family transcriptional regulator n=1 Tax=Alkalihalobacillus pseudalcaliphilus TaxID=79884 RepID=UPI00064D762A|nr:LysR family transcriptional regulator [Alkalihalobacillus pseudalcaliphilus]KMK75151.1 hypothetical protein AB990_17040 [Alkalihalobacillus pseudalcaliphilus]